jgi:hypothetical protein
LTTGLLAAVLDAHEDGGPILEELTVSIDLSDVHFS